MNQTIGVNITPQSFQPTLHYSQGDVGRVFVINVTDYDIPTGATVTCVATKPSGMGFTVSGTVSGNSVTFTSTAEMTDEWGRFPAEIRIASGNTLLGTANFLMIGEKDPHPASTIDGTQEELIPQLTLLVNRVEAAAESVHDLTVSATTLTAGSDATATYDSTNNSIAFGIPRGADGDVTRSEFNDLKSDFPLICGESNELDQVSYVDAKGIGENGNIIDAPALHYTSSMPVISGETYTVKTSYDISGDSAVLRIHGYDSSDSWVQQIAFHTFSNPEVYSVDITIPTGISAIRVSGKKTINFDYVVRKDNLSQRIDAVNNEVVDYQNNISTYRVPTNLYNKDSALNRDGYKVNTGNNYSADSGSSATHPIKLEVGKTYCYKAYISYFGASTNKIVHYCDADGALVPNAYIEATQASNSSYFYFTWTSARAGISDYVCVNVRKSEKSNMIFAEGDTLPSYSEYFDPFWQIKESAMPDEIPLPLNIEPNALYGKKMAVDGDSIMYGEGAAGGFAGIIGANNAMTVQNLARTGATLATGTTVDGGNRHWVASSVANLASDADYYIVEGGVNDFALSVALGAMTSGYTDTLDTTTVLGALESICKTLQTVFVGKKYGFVFTHKCYANTSTYITTWVPAMKRVLEKWGIPYLDLGELAPQLNNLDALRPYTLNGDGWHPTENGYKLFYVPKITAWMKTL